MPATEQAKPFRIEVFTHPNQKEASGTVIVKAENAKDLERELRNELTPWRIKFSNRSVQIATKKAMKVGRGYIRGVALITRVCEECYGSGVDYARNQICQACGGSGIPDLGNDFV